MFKKLNKRAKKLTLMDIKLLQSAVFFSAIIIVKLSPKLLTINYPVLIILTVACLAKPFYGFWIKK